MLPRCLPTALIILFIPSAAVSQTRIPVGGENVAVQLELTKPFFDDPGPFAGLGFITSILDATVIVPIRSGPTFFGIWGISFGTIDSGPSSQTLSNPRIGALFGGTTSTQAEVHVDLPFAKEFGDDDYATGVALFADYERLERFIPDTWSIGASVTPQRQLESGGTVGGRLGTTVWIPTEDEPDTELFALYSVFGRMPVGSAEVGGELSGLAVLSEDDLSFGERTTFFVTLSGGLPDAGAAPELYVRVPVDDNLTDVLDLVVGVRVRFGR